MTTLERSAAEPVRPPTYADLRAARRPVGLTDRSPIKGPPDRAPPQPESYLAILDETHGSLVDGNRFFIYGGILIPLRSLSDLDAALTSIRTTAGFPAGVPLKWSTPGPPVDPAQHRKAKSELLRACLAARAELFVSMCHSEVARGATASDLRLTWGANGVLRAIHTRLEELNGFALALVDSFPGLNPIPFLEEKGARGLVFPAVGGVPEESASLHRFAAFATTSAKASRIASALDVALGAFAYCLDETHLAAQEIAREVMPMLSRHVDGSVHSRGVSVYPARSRVARFRAAHAAVALVLAGYGVDDVPVYLAAG